MVKASTTTARHGASSAPKRTVRKGEIPFMKETPAVKMCKGAVYRIARELELGDTRHRINRHAVFLIMALLEDHTMGTMREANSLAYRNGRSSVHERDLESVEHLSRLPHPEHHSLDIFPKKIVEGIMRSEHKRKISAEKRAKKAEEKRAAEEAAE